MRYRYIVFDVETPNRYNNRMSAIGISLDHHKADSDSRACAEIFLRYLEGGANEMDFIRTYRL